MAAGLGSGVWVKEQSVLVQLLRLRAQSPPILTLSLSLSVSFSFSFSFLLTPYVYEAPFG